MKSIPRRHRIDIGALLFLGAGTALFFWPLWLKGYRFPKGGGDLWGQLYPVWSYTAEWLRRGVFPLWSTRLMGGDPIIAEPQYGLLNPLNWPLFLVHPIPSWLISLRSVASLWLAGAGLYLYLRRSPVWQVRPTPALVGALAYMFSDPFIAHLGHPQFNDTLAWLPWALWGLDGAVRHRRGILLSALALAALVLAGHGQAAIYAACLIAPYGLWQAIERNRGRGPVAIARSIARLALTALLAVAIAAPGLLPALERLPYTDRAILIPKLGEYETHPEMWRDFITPLYHGRNMKTFWAPWERVETGYIGIGALGLAALGLLSGRWRRTAFLSVVAVTATLFALGTQGPIYPVVAHLPLLDVTWKTGRAIFLLSFILALAAAAGTQMLLTRPIGLWRRLVIVAAAVGLATVIAVRALPWSLHAPNPEAVAAARLGLRVAAVALAGTGVLAALAPSSRLARGGLVLAALAELIVTGAWADIEPAPRADADPHAAAAAYLRADGGWFRVDVDGAARGLWSPASVMAAGFESPQGTGNPMEIVAYNQFYWGIPHKGMPAYHLLGTKYVIVPEGALPGADGIWPVYTDDPLVDIHLNTHALPRAWLVYHAISVDTLEAAYEHVFAADFEPWTTATVTGGPSLAGNGSGSIEVRAYGPNRAAFQIDTTERALLVLSDLLYPGWVARVDGEAAPIYATDGLFRGVVVPAGSHRVEMRFRPVSLRRGLGGLGMALLVLGLILRRNTHRWRRERTPDVADTIRGIL